MQALQDSRSLGRSQGSSLHEGREFVTYFEVESYYWHSYRDSKLSILTQAG